jgi:hypothetical protein
VKAGRTEGTTSHLKVRGRPADPLLLLPSMMMLVQEPTVVGPDKMASTVILTFGPCTTTGVVSAAPE